MQVRFPCLAVKCKLSWPDRDDEAKDQQIDTSNYNKHFFSQRYRPTILIKNEKWLKMHQAAAFTSIHNYIQDRWEGNHRVSGNVPHNTASLNSLSYGSRKGSNDLQSLLQVQVAHPQRSICWGQGPHGSDALDAWSRSPSFCWWFSSLVPWRCSERRDMCTFRSESIWINE